MVDNGPGQLHAKLDSLHSLAVLPPHECLAVLAHEFSGKIVFSTSFSWEDQVIAHMILAAKLPVKIFTLDTGRLFEETNYVWSRTNEQYQTRIEAYYPDGKSAESFVSAHGPNSFYESLENRKACCYIRKVEPLRRALAGNELWITGLRAEHSPERENLPQIEWDEGNNIIKYHPILHWSTEEVKSFIYEHGIPYNTLHDKGFVSIGCAPCTRAVRPGEDFRAGRWWWENKETKECGLHAHS
ncbi:phosphoadenylyl-sulfate reductase [Hufsiella ginkgonis]|uniref:Adenosine 5'-phosphosulfate reductase n=1 Tax=Hufsiella ginkgonis TaxID=2695274 RepID=A0A7K1XUR5_9SPHI|nr:phosphoadenylyl-sulfate reductase [Hufsiella ginkgonis]MXV14710.1 phosphoadenylyl-sulfate reductase [Hufsiella ginkgonis]